MAIVRAQPEDSTQQAAVLVVYYSRDGHTHTVAESLAKKFNADLERLIDTKNRSGAAGTSSAGKDAYAGALTLLEPLRHDPQRYDVILIGTPGWFGNVTPAVRTFIKENSLAGKKIGLFGTVNLTGIESALAQAAKLIAGDAGGKIPTLPLRKRDLKDDVLAQKIDRFFTEFNRADAAATQRAGTAADAAQ
ncbi:MAG: hypothetical protein NC924_02880 [Candidatus Omnitrophica bacterium]|nr:hypothetical protein [Candidatus Omnitrophota bacterium]